MRRIANEGSVPVLNKPAGIKALPDPAREIFTLTANARDFYVLGYGEVHERKGGSDWKTSPVTL